MLSINNLLKDKASTYFIALEGQERVKISNSIATLINRLKAEFGHKISDVIVFGSYKRGTILPREYDFLSDVDILVIFNHSTLGVRPITYRNYLRDFAKKYYSSSISYKDAPSVVLELGHIWYDLVPCYTENAWYSGLTYYIPRDDNSWMASDIDGFNKKLSDRNTQYNYIVKPIIRLFKAWNGKVNYPIPSYLLEQEIADMNFYGNNYQTGFFYAISQLNAYRGSCSTNPKIESLKVNANRVQEYLAKDEYQKAINWLGHILPL